MLLKEAFLLAAQRAGGGGEDGLVNYLERHANKTPAVFIGALSRIIPMQIESNAQGHITIEIIKRFDAEDPKLIEHKANGHANGKHDPAAE